MADASLKVKVDGGASFKSELTEINAKGKELDSEMKAVASSLDGVGKKFKSTSQQIKTLGAAMANQKSKIQTLNKQLQQQESRLDELKKAYKEAADAGNTAEAERYAAAIRKQETAISQTKTQINQATAELNRMNAELDKLGKTPLGALSNRFKEIGKQIQEAGTKIMSVGKGITTAVTLPIVAAGTAFVNAASDFDENLNKVSVAFGHSTRDVYEWSRTATEQFGLSQNAALEAAAQFGDMATSMGLTEEEAAAMSTSLAGLAGDLASFKNMSVDQAMTALNGIFTGESQSLKKLGVVMTQANLEQFAEDAGLVWKNMSEAEKVQLRYNYVLEKTRNAQGDYARTSDGTANSIRTMKATLENLSVTLGQQLLPIITPVIQKLTDGITALAEKWKALSPEQQNAILTIVGIVAAIGPAIIAIGAIVKGVGLLTTALGFVLTPAGLIIAALAALVALGYLIVTNWETIKAKAVEIWESIKTAVTEKINEAVTDLQGGWERTKADATAAWEGIKSKASEIWTNIKNTVTDKINAAKDAVQKAIDRIKELFSGELSFPHIKLPHFSISGSLSLSPPSVPHIGVEWYDKGGVFTSPSVIGVGEKRPEFVGALDDLRAIVREESGAGIDAADLYEAVREGASAARPIIILDGRDVTRSLRGLGVKFA